MGSVGKPSIQVVGKVAGSITGVTPPKRKDVIWQKPSLVGGNTKYLPHYWNGTEWKPFLTLEDDGDGNLIATYDTELDDAITMPFDVGGLEEGTTVAELKGDTLISIWDRLLFPSVFPELEQPSAIIQGSTPKVFEVGLTEDITINCSFDQGDAGLVNDYDLLKDGAEISNDDSYIDSAVLNSPGTIEYQGRYDYNEGDPVEDQFGNTGPNIAAGSVTTAIETYRWVLPVFYGSDSDGVIADPKTGTKELIVYQAGELEIALPDNGQTYYFICVPAIFGSFSEWEVTPLNAGPIGSGNTFENPTTIQLDINGNTFDYHLYVTGFQTEFDLPSDNPVIKLIP